MVMGLRKVHKFVMEIYFLECKVTKQ